MKKRGLFDWLLHCLMTIGAVIIVLDAIVVSLDVLARYMFNFTCVQLFEIVEFSLLWMTFLGAAWLLQEGGHVRVELLVSRLSLKRKRAFERFVLFLVLVLLGVLVLYSIKMVMEHAQSGTKLAGVLRPKRWIVEVIIPIGLAFMFIETAREFRVALKKGGDH
ncbi:MAG: TRAP transporter small permease [Thermoproteota archaeon]